MNQKTVSTRAWAELCLLSLFWGAGFLAIKLALDELGFATIVAYRVGFAALLLWLWVWWKGLTVPHTLRLWGAFLVMGFLNNVIPFTLMAWGQIYIETGLTAVFNAATAIFGVLAAAMFFADERLTSRKVAGVLIGFFGVATAIGLDAFRNFDIRSLAQLAVIGGTMSYALAGVWAKKKLGGLRPEVAAAGMLTGSTLIAVPGALWLDGVPTLALSGTTMASILFLASFGTAFAYLLYYRILAMAGAANLMLVTLLIPPVSIVLGAMVLSEALPLRVFIGLGLLALGLVILDGRLWRRMRGVEA